MKALTLHQPWALLAATGWKRIETRSWTTHYRGTLALHAAKQMPKYLKPSWWMDEPFLTAMIASEVVSCEPYNLIGMQIGTMYWYHQERLPLGCIVGVCDLIGIVQFDKDAKPGYGWSDGVRKWHLSQAEYAFGDFSPGRFGWLLDDVRILDEPIPARGYLGLWDWDGEDLLAEMGMIQTR